MSENNRTYRIRTNVGSNYNGSLNINVDLLQDYDEFEVLSLKIGTENLYKYHTSKYGCVVGRVLANGGVGIPNVKISSFIPVDDIDADDPIFSFLYPYQTIRDKNKDNIRYNLLTDTKIDDCHQKIGTFPNKRLVLDDNNVIEIFDKYYKFTTTTNSSGDYMLFGVPVGDNMIHSDLDLSDIGILSQKPRDLFYKGYTAKQFENASQFKKDTNLDNLTQVISQDSSVYVFPFWGDENENKNQIKIVRNDIDINYKFVPTCIFIGCIVSDEKSNAISKNCIPHERMGKMDRLTTGNGTIEMIRKTTSGSIESFSIQGNELIDGNGTWCYQIPMNLDYVTTDEYGNLVPTDDHKKGLPTRTSVRFRVSLSDYESDSENAHLVKVLVPNNPKKKVKNDGETYIDYDYEFGSATKDEQFRDLLWNNVYTVKSYIPRIQKGNRQRNKNFTGIKAVNVNGANNPIPYNNMRINLTFLFVFQCLIFKGLMMIVKFLNKIIYILDNFRGCGTTSGPSLAYITLDGGMCPPLEGNYIAPGAKNVEGDKSKLIENTYNSVYGEELELDTKEDNVKTRANEVSGTIRPYDKKSSDFKNGNYNKEETEKEKSSTKYEVEDVNSEDNSGKAEEEYVKIYNTEDYFIKCVELQFAMEYEVIQFDFYNDWINGMIYIPRWFAEIKPNKDRAYYCGNSFSKYRYLTQQCALAYDSDAKIPQGFNAGCESNSQKCHKRYGRKKAVIFGKKYGGIVKAQKTSRNQYAYYLRPSELIDRGMSSYANKDVQDMISSGNELQEKLGENNFVKANLFSTDIVLLGSVSDCNRFGIPKVNGYTSSSFKMPPPTSEIVSDTQEMGLEYEVLTGEQCVEQFFNGINGNIKKVFTKLMGSYVYWVDEDKNDGFMTFEEAIQTVSNCSFQNGYITNELKKLEGIIFNYSEKTFTDGEIHKDIYYYSLTINLCKGFLYLLNQIFDTSGYTCKKTKYVAISNNYFNLDSYNYQSDVNKTTIPQKFEYSVCNLYNYIDNDNDSELYDQWLECKKNSPNNSFKRFYAFTKKLVYANQLDGINSGETVNDVESTYSEISGIDWGYNPFKVKEDDDTRNISNQTAGHFLEIGCTFSLSNIKSCVNLQRICEIGSEMSQSHYYLYKDVNEGGYSWRLIDPSGIIAKREISDGGIRSKFATMNSNSMTMMYDKTNGYKKYNFYPYSPVSFMGELENKKEIDDLRRYNSVKYENFGLIENQSLSYKAFRFGTTDSDITSKFLIEDNNGWYYMPQYENSFYFYFGIRDGNTAIDRLYSEYYAQCETNSDTPEIMFTVDGIRKDYFIIHYRTENMSMIKSIIVKFNGATIKIGKQGDENAEAIWNRKNSTIEVFNEGIYTIAIKDINNVSIKQSIECKYDGSEPVSDKNVILTKYYKNNECYIHYESVNFSIDHVTCNYRDNAEPIVKYQNDEKQEFTLEIGYDVNFIFFSLHDEIITKQTHTKDIVKYELKKCDNDMYLVKYNPNFEVSEIDGSNIMEIDYEHKTFKMRESQLYETVSFKGRNESIVYDLPILPYIDDTEEHEDDYTVNFKITCYENDTRYCYVYYAIEEYFNVSKIYINDIELVGDKLENALTNKSLELEYGHENIVIKFEDEEGNTIERKIKTNYSVSLDYDKFQHEEYVFVDYNANGFEVASITSETVYDKNHYPIAGWKDEYHSEANESVFDIDIKGKNFKIYNGYNKDGNTRIEVKFINNYLPNLDITYINYVNTYVEEGEA